LARDQDAPCFGFRRLRFFCRAPLASPHSTRNALTNVRSCDGSTATRASAIATDSARWYPSALDAAARRYAGCASFTHTVDSTRRPSSGSSGRDSNWIASPNLAGRVPLPRVGISAAGRIGVADGGDASLGASVGDRGSPVSPSGAARSPRSAIRRPTARRRAATLLSLVRAHPLSRRPPGGGRRADARRAPEASESARRDRPGPAPCRARWDASLGDGRRASPTHA
jgi:hypothetical protein